MCELRVGYPPRWRDSVLYYYRHYYWYQRVFKGCLKSLKLWDFGMKWRQKYRVPHRGTNKFQKVTGLQEFTGLKGDLLVFAVLKTRWKPHKSKDRNFLHRSYTNIFFSTPKKFQKKNRKKLFFGRSKKHFWKKNWEKSSTKIENDKIWNSKLADFRRQKHEIFWGWTFSGKFFVPKKIIFGNIFFGVEKFFGV